MLYHLRNTRITTDSILFILFYLLLLNEYLLLCNVTFEGCLSLLFKVFSKSFFSAIFRYILSFSDAKETDILIGTDHARFLQLAQSFDYFLFRFSFFILIFYIVFLNILIEVLFRPLGVRIIEFSVVYFKEQLFLKVL